SALNLGRGREGASHPLIGARRAHSGLVRLQLRLVHIRQTEETPARRATWHRGEIALADPAVQRVRGDAFQLGGMGSRAVAFSVRSAMGFVAHKHPRKRKMPA